MAWIPIDDLLEAKTKAKAKAIAKARAKAKGKAKAKAAAKAKARKKGTPSPADMLFDPAGEAPGKEGGKRPPGYKPPETAKVPRDREYKPPTPAELEKKVLYKPPTPKALAKKQEKEREQKKQVAAKQKPYKPPTPKKLAKRTMGYKVPSPVEVAKKIKKTQEKERKKKERAREKEAGIVKQKAKKRAAGGQRKKPPKQKPRPGVSDAKPKVDRVPAQLAHCILAVRGGKGKKGGKKYDTRAAWNICRWSLTRHGYLKPPYKKGGQLKNVRQTQKGARRTMKHAMEPEAPDKYKRFKDLFRDIEPTV